MTIPHEWAALTSAVRPTALERSGRQSPFISLKDLETLCKGDEELEIVLREMVLYALRYAETVCRFQQVVREGQQSNEDGTRGEIEIIRSSVHDVAIATINTLSRALKSAGKDNEWIRSVMMNGRASYCKFALLIAFEAVNQTEETA